MSTNFDNSNRAVLFKNEDKRDDRDPDYRGNVNVDGKEFWLDFWVQTSKKSGKKFMSGRIKPKTAPAQAGNSLKHVRDEFDDQIPF